MLDDDAPPESPEKQPEQGRGDFVQADTGYLVSVYRRNGNILRSCIGDTESDEEVILEFVAYGQLVECDPAQRPGARRGIAVLRIENVPISGGGLRHEGKGDASEYPVSRHSRE